MIVFQFHLSINGLLRSLLYERLCRIPGRAVFSDQQNIDYVSKLSTSQAIDLAARLGVLTELGRNELVRLNKIRNDCAHNWTLHSNKMVKKTRDGPKKRKYKIEFNGKNLLNLKSMEGEFIPLYSGVYLELFATNYRNGSSSKQTSQGHQARNYSSYIRSFARLEKMNVEMRTVLYRIRYIIPKSDNQLLNI